MKFSMNGFRKTLSSDVSELRDLVQRSIDGDLCSFEHEEFRDAMNKVITHSNVINCVYSNDDDDFSDLSHIEIEHLEGDL